mmetsp:Transcript_15645/g.29505  ORF Transcript_15645/g.29505 Transcript_15645/m.29505 type:complete len:662 (-) Transcript_15645:98-2083(-)
MSNSEFLSSYLMKEMIGKGAFGTVWKAEDNQTHVNVAVKVIDRRKLKPKDDEAVYQEVNVMKNLRMHPNIVNLVNFFESETLFHVVLELAEGGDLFDRLSKRRFYTEIDARSLAKNIIIAVDCIHSSGYVHRDLKPDNLLLKDMSDDCNGLMVADFGFAKENKNDRLRTRCGTPAFVAPEVCSGILYGNKVDMWSCGVIVYLLLAGYAPFHHKDLKELFRMIRAADYSFHEKYWDSISTPAKKLITQMLTVDPSKRISAAEALKSEWMTASEDELGRMAKMPLTNTLDKMKTFVARNKLRGAMIATTFATTAKFWAGNSVSFMSQNTTFNSSAFTSTRTLTNGKVGQTFNDVYALDRKIRDGRISGIWIGCKRDISESKKVAIKVITVDKSNHHEEARIMNEVAILKSLDHPNVLKLIDFFEESPNFFLVMELMEGGDLFDRIAHKMQYTEMDARQLALSLLQAVQHIHSRCVAHRDLKPQNLLLKSIQNDVDIKVSDFSFAKRVHTPKSLLTRCGTPTYVAPEILKNHPHDERADMWSVGVILFVTLVGYPPFIEEDQRVLFRKIRLGEYCFENEDWSNRSKESRDLITKLLVVDPDQRWTASQALNHKWFTGNDSSRRSASHDMSQKIDKLKISVSSFGDENRSANKNYQSFSILPDEQ